MPPAQGAMLFVLLVIVTAAFAGGMTVFMRTPAPWVIKAFLGFVMLGAIGLVAASVVGGRTARFELSDRSLRLRGDLYGRTVPRAMLRTAEARRVDLGYGSPVRPTARTVGTAVPGYSAGWFRLADGSRALLYVSDGSRVVHVPTTSDYALLLSVDDPERFLAALRASPTTRPAR